MSKRKTNIDLAKSYSSAEIIAILETDGWIFKNANGDHHHYTHPTKPGKVTLAHPVKDVPKGTLRSILRQAGLI